MADGTKIITIKTMAEITTNGGTYQVNAAILPEDATDKSLVWTITNGMGKANINTTGLVTAVGNGTVTVEATAMDGSGISGTLNIEITNQKVLITSIILT